ncbi:MAG: substrate-binding domain-containing protein [Candidatus Competibacteraceae bacterium]|nr:substrate-binding domain-containing protein [Candidatus Competibacteraceae bacterium]
MNRSKPPSRRTVEPLAAIRLAGLLLALAVSPLLPSAARAQEQPIKIGFLLKTMQEERYRTDKAEFIARAQALGAQVLFDSSGNSELTQLRQFEKLLDDGAQVIVLQPVNTGLAGTLVRLANQKGVKVVGYDAMVVNGPLDLMVMQDSWAVGRLQAEAMVRWFQRTRGKVEGKVALIMGQPGDSNAEAMSQGALDAIRQNPGLTLVAQVAHVDWSPDRAAETASNVLVKHRNGVDAFICNNSGLASGVIAALDLEKLADAEKVFVAGADADLKNIRYIVQGKQAAEVWKPIKPLAHKAAEIAVDLVRNPGKPPESIARAAGQDGLRFAMTDNGFAKVPTVITPVVLIGKENVDSALIAEKIFSEEQVYGGEAQP